MTRGGPSLRKTVASTLPGSEICKVPSPEQNVKRCGPLHLHKGTLGGVARTDAPQLTLTVICIVLLLYVDSNNNVHLGTTECLDNKGLTGCMDAQQLTKM